MLFSLQQLSILDVFSLEMCAFNGEQVKEKKYEKKVKIIWFQNFLKLGEQ